MSETDQVDPDRKALEAFVVENADLERPETLPPHSKFYEEAADDSNGRYIVRPRASL
jgi:hypothetical protein